MTDVSAIINWAASGLMVGMLVTVVAIVLSALLGRLRWILPLTAFFFFLAVLFLPVTVLLLGMGD